MTELYSIENKRQQAMELLEKRQKVQALLAARNAKLQLKLTDPRHAPEDFGAPAHVRFKVGRAKTPQDKLEVLQQHFPLAAPTERGDNFVYIDPESGKKVLYDDPGLDMGDVAENARTVAQVGVPAALSFVPGVGAIARNPVGAAAISTGVGEGVDAMGRAMGVPDPRTPGQRLQGAATNFVGESALGAAFPGAINAARRIFARPEAGAVFRSAQDLGVQPTAGMMGRSSVRSAEQAAKAVPGPGGIVEGAQSRAVRQADAAAERIADSAGDVRRASGPAGTSAREFAGRPVQEMLDPANKEGVLPFFRDRSSQIFQQVDGFFAPDEVVPMTNTTQIVEDLGRRFGRLKNTAKRELPKELRETLDDLAEVNNQPTWAEADQLRKAIGEKIGQPGPQQEASDKQLRRLYDALTADQEAAVLAKGGRAADLWNRGKVHRKAFEGRVKLLSSLTKEEDPVKAYEKVTKMSAPQLRTLKKSMLKAPGGESAWDDLVATRISEMGRMTPGQEFGDVIVEGAEAAQDFSPSRMVTAFNEMRKAGTDKVWFDGPLRREMQKLYNVASAQKLVGAQANFSNTASHNFWQNLMIWGYTASLAGPAIGAAVAYGMERPAFVRWMAQGLGPQGKNAAMHMGRLQAMAARDPYLQPVADALTGAYQEQSQQEAAAQLPPVTM